MTIEMQHLFDDWADPWKGVELTDELTMEIEKKISGRIMPGSRCAWCFREDTEFWVQESSHGYPYPHPRDWPYQGFIIPKPDSNGRHELQWEDAVVVVTDYPIDKENPTTDWCSLIRILRQPDLARFYVFSPILTRV